MKAFIQDQNKQSNIINCYTSVFQKHDVWANVTFSTHDETLAAFEQFKNNLVKFRDNWIYASLKNVKDHRTVVISTVKKDVTEQQFDHFLTELAALSNRLDKNDENKGRKFDFFSFNIIEQKTFYIDDEDNSVGV